MAFAGRAKAYTHNEHACNLLQRRGAAAEGVRGVCLKLPGHKHCRTVILEVPSLSHGVFSFKDVLSCKHSRSCQGALELLCWLYCCSFCCCSTHWVVPSMSGVPSAHGFAKRLADLAYAAVGKQRPPEAETTGRPLVPIYVGIDVDRSRGDRAEKEEIREVR